MYESVLDVPADGIPAAVERVLASAHAARVAAYEHAGTGLQQALDLLDNALRPEMKTLLVPLVDPEVIKEIPPLDRWVEKKFLPVQWKK